MNLDIDDIELNTYGKHAYVRISMGGHMYMDTPHTTPANAKMIYNNIKQRISSKGLTEAEMKKMRDL